MQTGIRRAPAVQPVVMSRVLILPARHTASGWNSGSATGWGWVQFLGSNPGGRRRRITTRSGRSCRRQNGKEAQCASAPDGGVCRVEQVDIRGVRADRAFLVDPVTPGTSSVGLRTLVQGGTALTRVAVELSSLGQGVNDPAVHRHSLRARIRDMGPHLLVSLSFQASLELETVGQIYSMPEVQNEYVRNEVVDALSGRPVLPSMN